MDDDEGRPHYHVDWSPSPEHRAAIRGTPEQRRKWAADERAIMQEAADLERSGKMGNPAANIMHSFLRRRELKT